MVTSAFIFSFLFLTLGLAIFDMDLYEQTYMTALKNIIFEEFISSSPLLILPFSIGILSSVIIDIRYIKNKKFKRDI